VVGIGPGDPLDRTRRAEAAIIGSDVVVGYRQYLDLVEDLTKGKEIVASGMTQEVERCRAALRQAAAGKIVSLVSSGDSGVYGMAGLALEMAVGEDFHATIEVIPGVTSANAAAARLGAPLMLDYATISLSDLLVSWATIRARLEAVAAADLVVALYNPRSRKRIRHLEEAAEIFRAHRPETTPVGIATAVGRKDEQILLSDLDHFLNEPIGMRSMVIIGNSASRTARGWFITPRGYRL
jgi:precorrin-3B C17-methyltransferase